MKKLIALILLLQSFALLAENNPLIVATMKNDFKQVKELLTEKPELLNQPDAGKWTALHWAGIKAYWDIFEYLLDAGAELNGQGADGGTPLNWLVHHDNLEMVKKIVEKGAKLNVQNQWGMTELHTAVWRGCMDVTKYLLDKGCDPYIKTKEGWTVMHMVHRSGHDNIIEMLKARGISMTEKDNDDRTPDLLYFKKPNAISMSPEEMDEYVGTYYIGEYPILKIWREDDELHIMEYGPDKMYPVAKDFFYFEQAPWTLIFSRDEEGRISQAQLSFIRRSYTIKRK